MSQSSQRFYWIIRKLRKWSLVMVAVLVGGYGLSNLCLALPWTRDAIASQLKQRTGTDWKIGGLTWSPWNGVVVRDLQVLQPEALRGKLSEPVLEVERLQVKPYWSLLLHRELVLKEVVVESPHATVTVEMLMVLAENVMRNQVAEPRLEPPSSENPKLPSTTLAGSGGEKPSGEKPPKVAKNPKSKSEGATPKRQKPREQQPASSRPRPQVARPMVLKIHGGELKLVSVQKNMQLLEVGEVSLELPLLGEDAVGELRMGRCQILGVPEMKSLTQKVAWKRPYLEVENLHGKWGDLKFAYKAQFGVVAKSPREKFFPFSINVVVPSQKFEWVHGLERVAMEVRAEQVGAQFQCSGLALHPSSWRANMLLLAGQIRVKEKHGGHDIVFDEAVLPAGFRQGVLQWQGVRLIGEDVSVLGNGRVSPRGEILSVTRLVVSPEVSKMVVRGLQGARLVSHGNQWWSDLGTPDRKMRDLLVTGSMMNPVVDIGYHQRELPVWPLVRKTISFIREEMLEEKLAQKMKQ